MEDITKKEMLKGCSALLIFALAFTTLGILIGKFLI